MANRIYSKKGFTPEQLSEPEFVAMITETYRILTLPLHQSINNNLSDSYIKQEISPELTASLEQNAFMFSGFKIFHQANEIDSKLKGDDGGFKPYSKFQQEVIKIDETYNKHYLRSEYNFATQSTLSAIKWKNFEADGDRYDLQYRTAADERVRDEHAALHNTTLPPSDPFWNSYFPPNGWNCRCVAVQVRKGKYAQSNSADAIAAGEKATTKIGKNGINKAAIFRFNPGKEMKLMPPKHPYLPKGCGNCTYKGSINLVFDNEKAICKACRMIDATSVKWSRDRVREHFQKQLKEKSEVWEINNGGVDKLTVSYQDIKTVTGKPHKYPYARNMSVYYLKPIFKKQATYLGSSPDFKGNAVKGHTDNTIWHYYEIPFMGKKSYLEIKTVNGVSYIHNIHDDEHFNLDKIKNKVNNPPV